MKLFYAHYPSLENTFLRLACQRSALEPWLVVCASSWIAKRLNAQLARKQGVVANIHFCTLSSFLRTLDGEAGPAKPVFPQDYLRDFLLKDILNEPGLNKYPVSRGFVGALKSALRDLADTLVDPDTLEEHLRLSAPAEEGTQDYERFAWFVRVYKRYLEREAALPPYRPYQDFFERALAQVERSAYLKQFSQIVLYGFYDMNGRQLELVNRLRAQFSLTVFAPYGKFPSYAFAQKFFETNWLGMCGGGQDENEDDCGALAQSGHYLFAAQGSAPTSGVRIVPSADPAGEVFFAAKEILRLVEEEKYTFADIAVLARVQIPYQEEIRRVFAQNKIPLQGSFAYPLAHAALGAFCLRLFTLAAHGFAREEVLAVLSSPYFARPEKQSWYRLAGKSLVGVHLNQWRDLLPQTEGYDPGLLAWLEDCSARLSALDLPGPWAEKCELAWQFFTDYTDLNALHGKEEEIYDRLKTCIRSLSEYSAVRTTCHSGEFLQELIQVLSSLSFNDTEAAVRGVTFTDAVRARGLQFKVVFLLGVNEKIFPQLVPEDPIFRDRYRYVLRDVLGYWINQRSERTQEERLLFFTACSAAREKLYVSYANRGADGKETVPSVYVAELARATEQKWSAQESLVVSARLTDRLAAVNPLLFTPKEMSYACVLKGPAAVGPLQAAGLCTPDTERQLAAAQALNRTGPAGAFDGYIAQGKEVFAQEQKKGFSPSSLQDLAACPMKYFFRKVLHLADKEEVASRHELAADKRGRLYHRVLEDFYRELNRLGLTHQLFDSGAAELLHRVLARVYTPQSYRMFGIYPVVWELILEQTRVRLTSFVQEDIKNLGAFTPAYFEREFPATDIPGFPFRLRGIIDRIDILAEEKTFRVVDYKSSRKGTKKLASSLFTHLIFQPFLYPAAAEKWPELAGFSWAESCLLSVQNGYEKSTLSAEEWTELQPQAEKLFSLLAALVQEGTFVLNPSDLCAYCPYRSVCRKDSFSCLMRARKSVPAARLEEARYGI